MAEPLHCRQEAFDYLATWRPQIETADGLLHGALAIAMHGPDPVDPDAVEAQLAAHAEAVRGRVQGTNADAILAWVHDELFDRAGYRGNEDDYYDPANSYLPAMLETRRGLPITLTLLYKNVVERLGLTVEGINAPLHFIAGVETGEGRMLVDVFRGGRPLSEGEFLASLEQMTGADFPRSPGLLQAATHRQWLLRMLRNLENAFLLRHRAHDVAAMQELATLLG